MHLYSKSELRGQQINVAKIIITTLKTLGFYFNCEHVLIVNIENKKIFFADFIIHKPSWGSRDVLHKIWAQSVQPFIGYKQTDRVAKFIYSCYDISVSYLDYRITRFVLILSKLTRFFRYQIV